MVTRVSGLNLFSDLLFQRETILIWGCARACSISGETFLWVIVQVYVLRRGGGGGRKCYILMTLRAKKR